MIPVPVRKWSLCARHQYKTPSLNKVATAITHFLQIKKLRLRVGVTVVVPSPLPLVIFSLLLLPLSPRSAVITPLMFFTPEKVIHSGFETQREKRGGLTN
jgi:hypothetical protein